MTTSHDVATKLAVPFAYSITSSPLNVSVLCLGELSKPSRQTIHMTWRLATASPTIDLGGTAQRGWSSLALLGGGEQRGKQASLHSTVLPHPGIPTSPSQKATEEPRTDPDSGGRVVFPRTRISLKACSPARLRPFVSDFHLSTLRFVLVARSLTWNPCFDPSLFLAQIDHRDVDTRSNRHILSPFPQS
ncbi:hypothetical protein LZ30DRAFT_738211 [Colletotrichum cereale]|nr:hypothetical protein LZ30DRAFT_738211 [Colletotrichum cereale]